MLAYRTIEPERTGPSANREETNEDLPNQRAVERKYFPPSERVWSSRPLQNKRGATITDGDGFGKKATGPADPPPLALVTPAAWPPVDDNRGILL